MNGTSNFALLSIGRIPKVHSGFAALKQRGQSSRLLLGELVRTEAFRAMLLAAPKDRRLALFVSRYRRVYHLPQHKTNRAIVDGFLPFVEQADELITSTVSTYVPERYHRRLRIQKQIRSFRGLVEQYLYCFPTAQDGRRAARKRFEVRRRLLLAQYLFEIAEGEGRTDLLAYDRKLLEEYLAERFFIPGRREPASVFWVRDPAHQNRVVRVLEAEAADGDGPIRRLADYRPGVQYQFFRWRDGSAIPVICFVGTKDPFPHLLKMFVKNLRPPEAVVDLRRVMLVFRNRRELLRGLQVLRRDIFDVEGTIADQRWSIDGAVVGDPRSPATADAFRHLQFTVLIGGRRYEVQILLLVDWLNSIASDGPEHHAQYKAKQYYDTVFPLLFPFEIFRINWKSPRVRLRFTEKICASNHR